MVQKVKRKKKTKKQKNLEVKLFKLLVKYLIVIILRICRLLVLFKDWKIRIYNVSNQTNKMIGNIIHDLLRKKIMVILTALK